MTEYEIYTDEGEVVATVYEGPDSLPRLQLELTPTEFKSYKDLDVYKGIALEPLGTLQDLIDETDMPVQFDTAARRNHKARGMEAMADKLGGDSEARDFVYANAQLLRDLGKAAARDSLSVVEWQVTDKNTGESVKEFTTRTDARSFIESLHPSVGALYEAVPVGSSLRKEVFMEGLSKGDLNSILLPKISLDEYVPGNPEENNIVLAFFIRGVPEAAHPLMTYCERCRGVDDVDMGDSDTLNNTFIVYVEFKRDSKSLVNHIVSCVEEVSNLAEIDPRDITISIASKGTVPFSAENISKFAIAIDADSTK